MAASTRCFTAGAGLVLSDGLATLTSVTRLSWVRLSLRLAPSPHNLGLRASDCSIHTPSRLHGQRLITKVNSFQFTRTRPVSLTHRRRKERQKGRSSADVADETDGSFSYPCPSAPSAVNSSSSSRDINTNSHESTFTFWIRGDSCFSRWAAR